MRYGHAEALLPMVESAMNRAGLRPDDLDIVAVCTGPGGFTGLRAGIAAAHGIALATGARLVGVPAFAAVAAARGSESEERPGALLVALDTRRRDIYVQLFDSARRPLGTAEAISAESLPGWVAAAIGAAPLVVAGDAAAAAAAALAERPLLTAEPDSPTDARGVASAGLRSRSPARPLYLRAPDVTLPRLRQMPG